MTKLTDKHRGLIMLIKVMIDQEVRGLLERNPDCTPYQGVSVYTLQCSFPECTISRLRTLEKARFITITKPCGFVGLTSMVSLA